MAKSISKIIGYTFVSQVAIFLLVVLNNILVSRWLGPAHYGMMATLLIFAETVKSMTNLGQETAILYYISNRKFEFRKLMDTAVWNGLGIYLLGALLIVIIIQSGLLSVLFEASEALVIEEGVWWALFLLFAAILHEYGSKVWLGQQAFKRYNGNLLVRPLIYLLLVSLVYVNELLSVPAVLIIYATSWLLPGIYIWIKSILPVSLRWDREISRETLRYGMPIMLANLMGFLIYRVDIFLIGYYLDQAHVGWYYVAVMVAERLFYLTNASGIILFPTAARAAEQQQKTPFIARINLLVVFIGAVLLALAAPWIIPLVFSDQYQNSVLPLLLLLPGIVAITLPKIISADLLARGLPQYSMAITAVNFVVNIILNIWLIPRMGIAGAALSSTISYSVAALLMVFTYRRLTGTAIRDLLLPYRSDWQEIRQI